MVVLVRVTCVNKTSAAGKFVTLVFESKTLELESILLQGISLKFMPRVPCNSSAGVAPPATLQDVDSKRAAGGSGPAASRQPRPLPEKFRDARIPGGCPPQPRWPAVGAARRPRWRLRAEPCAVDEKRLQDEAFLPACAQVCGTVLPAPAIALRALPLAQILLLANAGPLGPAQCIDAVCCYLSRLSGSPSGFSGSPYHVLSSRPACVPVPVWQALCIGICGGTGRRGGNGNCR
jgi:hypothetical protein